MNANNILKAHEDYILHVNLMGVTVMRFSATEHVTC